VSQIYVAEFPNLGSTPSQDGAVNILPFPPTVEYNVIVSAASSGAATAFLPSTKFIGVSTDTTCSIAIGLFPGVIGTGSAGVTNTRLAANERIIIRVPDNPINTAPQGGLTIHNNGYAIFTTANV
jgi:hypothetical protein